MLNLLLCISLALLVELESGYFSLLQCYHFSAKNHRLLKLPWCHCSCCPVVCFHMVLKANFNQKSDHVTPHQKISKKTSPMVLYCAQNKYKILAMIYKIVYDLQILPPPLWFHRLKLSFIFTLSPAMLGSSWLY